MGPRSIFPPLFTPSIYFPFLLSGCSLSFVNSKAGGIDNSSILVGSKVTCCVCRSTPTLSSSGNNFLAPLTPTCISASPPETNLCIFTDGNLPQSTSSPSTWGNQRGALLLCHHKRQSRGR